MATAKAVITEALKHVGYKETGNNITMFGKWYGMNGAAWCAMFVSYCMNKAGAGALIKGAQTAKGSAVVSGFVKHAKKHKWEKVAPANAHLGDIVIFDFPGGYETDHVGFIRANSKGKNIYTIEGNTSSGTGSQSNGGGVYKRTRSFGVVHSIWRPPYDPETPAVIPVAPNNVAPEIIEPVVATPAPEVSPISVENIEPGDVRFFFARGSKGAEVKKAQAKLGITADGIFGQITEAHVKAFQIKKGIKPTGILNTETWNRLFK